MNAEQQSFLFAPAVRPRRNNIVIEAGAGTGKTTAIVGEVLRLILFEPDLDLERIVLMTFTEKAAGEIADRIREAVEQIERDPKSWPPDSPSPVVTITNTEEARATCRRQMANIEALRSQTIHSFCQGLLRQFPIEAGVDPQFRIIEGFERSLLHGQLYDAWIDEETRDGSRAAEWELLMGHVGYLFQIRELIFDLVDRRDLLAEEDFEVGDVSEIEQSLHDALYVLSRSGHPDLGRIVRHINAHEPPPIGSSIDVWIDYFAPIAADIRQVDLPRGKANGAASEALKILRTDSDRKGNSVYDRLVSHRAAVALHALARRFLAFLDREKTKLGVVDFDDLLLRTLALLDNASVLSRVRGQFDYIFVDEFQDTDRTQARIIDRLARDAGDAFVPGKTIVVGDPKQSIYAFRRADPETYHRLTQELIQAGAEHRVIADQYRSDAPLVDAVNVMFGALFQPSPHDPNVFRPEYHELRAARARLHRELDARITLLYAEREARAEAEATAAWIKGQGGEDLRRFAILFRRLTRIDDYLDVFDRHFDYVLPPTRLFLDRRAPVDLLAVLRAVAYPFDRGAQISAARTPYFALTDVEIVEGGAAWTTFSEAMAAYRDAARRLTVAELIDHVIATSNIEAVYDAAADGERSKRHLEHLRSMAFAYDWKIGGGAGEFVDEIARRRAEPEEAEPSLIDESRNAVRIMTVHGAKGLEFETVILPDLEFPVKPAELFTVDEPKSLVMRGQTETLSSWCRTAGELRLRDVATERERAETQRLFYVAVTRAKSDVVFVCNAESQNRGFVACMHEALGHTRDTVASHWPAEEGRNVVRGAFPIAFEKVAVAGGERKRRRLIDQTLERELAEGEIVDFVPPRPAERGEGPRSGGEGLNVARQRARMKNRDAGILLHRVLERWDGQAPVDPLLTALSSELAVEPAIVARVRQRLAVVAKSPSWQRIVRAETLGRELPLLTDSLNVIDRLVREEGGELVIDYKSGEPAPERLTADREQVARYCTAVSRMTGRPCNGALWYIDDENDQWVPVT